MARVIVAAEARDDPRELIRSRSLPGSVVDRVRGSVEQLRTFPLLGPALEGRWDGFRFLVGPWPWLLIVYVYDESADLVIVVAFEDARSAASPRSADQPPSRIPQGDP